MEKEDSGLSSFLEMDNPCDSPIVSLLIKQSKTDQESREVKVYIGKTGNDLCPVAALLAYLSRRGDKPGPYSVGEWIASYKVQVCDICQNSSGESWPPGKRLCWP